MRLFLLLFVFLGSVNAGAVAQPDTVIVKKTITLKTDTSKITIRKFDERAIKEYSRQKDFIYDDVKNPPGNESLWDRFWRWLGRLFERWFGRSTGKPWNNPFSFEFVKYILIGAVTVLVIFIIIKLAGLDLKIFSKKSKSAEVPFYEALENIHIISFDDEIEKAIQNSNYRLAVRLLYLKTLKHLSDKNIIDWKPEKINQTYIAEIENEDKRQQFSILTRQFEYVWYGEFFIDKENFNQINNSFHQFNLKTA
ncbi:MAG: hypothetical protein WBP45_15385 [Daejeonella sp.]